MNLPADAGDWMQVQSLDGEDPPGRGHDDSFPHSLFEESHGLRSLEWATVHGVKN